MISKSVGRLHGHEERRRGGHGLATRVDFERPFEARFSSHGGAHRGGAACAGADLGAMAPSGHGGGAAGHAEALEATERAAAKCLEPLGHKGLSLVYTDSRCLAIDYKISLIIYVCIYINIYICMYTV